MARPKAAIRPALLELRAALARRRIRHDVFAARLGIRGDYLSHVLSGRRPAHGWFWLAAASALGCAESEIRPAAAPYFVAERLPRPSKAAKRRRAPVAA